MVMALVLVMALTMAPAMAMAPVLAMALTLAMAMAMVLAIIALTMALTLAMALALTLAQVLVMDMAQVLAMTLALAMAIALAELRRREMTGEGRKGGGGQVSKGMKIGLAVLAFALVGAVHLAAEAYTRPAGAWGAYVDPASYGLSGHVTSDNQWKLRSTRGLAVTLAHWTKIHQSQAYPAVKAKVIKPMLSRYMNLSEIAAVAHSLNPAVSVGVLNVATGSEYPAGRFWPGWGFPTAMWGGKQGGGMWQMPTGAWCVTRGASRTGLSMVSFCNGKRERNILNRRWFAKHFGSAWAGKPIGAIVPRIQWRRVTDWRRGAWDPRPRFFRSISGPTAHHVAAQERPKLLRP